MRRWSRPSRRWEPELEMTRVAMRLFAERDVVGAEEFADLDELIDRANRRVVKHVLELVDRSLLQEWGLRMIIVSRCLSGSVTTPPTSARTAYRHGRLREFTDASHPEGVSSSANRPPRVGGSVTVPRA